MSFISKTLNDYLFGTGGETKIVNLRIGEWEKKYKNFLSHLITFVGGDNNGAVYKSDNWDMVGHTAGLPDHKSLSMKWDNKSQLKTKFVKPTGENKKLIFVTEIKR